MKTSFAFLSVKVNPRTIALGVAIDDCNCCAEYGARYRGWELTGGAAGHHFREFVEIAGQTDAARGWT
jgi:hypothetical protein